MIRSVSARCGVGIHVIEHEGLSVDLSPAERPVNFSAFSGKHVHVVVQTNGLVGVVLTAADYPKRVTISMIREQMGLFEKEHG